MRLDGTAADLTRTDGRAGLPCLVADLGATHLRIALEEAGQVSSVSVRRTESLPLDPDDGIAPAVVAELRDAWAALAPAPSAKPAGVGVGVAAYVARDGSVLQARPFGLVPGPALRNGLAEAFGCPVAVDNDANVAALGELRFGAGRGCEDFLLLTLGTNIGMGVVCEGRILRGAHGAAGEPGNMLVTARRGRGGRDRLARAGRLGVGETNAPAGYAWLEDVAGGGAFGRALAALDRSAVPDRSTAPDESASFNPSQATPRPHVFIRARDGDRRALSVTRRAIEAWSVLVADLVALFDPARIILSGGLTEDVGPFLEPLRRRAAELSPLPPDIRIGELGAQAGLVGAAVAARSAIAAVNPSEGAVAMARGPSHPRPDQRPVVTRR